MAKRDFACDSEIEIKVEVEVEKLHSFFLPWMMLQQEKKDIISGARSARSIAL